MGTTAIRRLCVAGRLYGRAERAVITDRVAPLDMICCGTPEPGDEHRG